MKERPILFSAPMVRAILDGSKTQTRLAVKPQPDLRPEWDGGDGLARYYVGDKCVHQHSCPYGAPGDRLWVREEHYRFGHWEIVPGVKTKAGRMKWKFVPDLDEIRFEAPTEFRKGRHQKDPGTPAWHKRLARFMPRWALRITLEITGVRVERLQDISEADAKVEGIERSGKRWKHYFFPDDPSASWEFASNSFASLWAKINGEESLEANPWVWVIEFKRVTK